MKRQEKASVKTEETFLHRLGKALLRYFPIEQVREILEDYQEHFSLGRERHGTNEAMIAALGSPEMAAADLLREMPEGWSYRMRHTLRWGTPLLLACAGLILRYAYAEELQIFGTYFSLTAGPVFLFLLLHGPEQAEIEGRFLRPVPRPKAALYLLPILAVMGMEALPQWLIHGLQGYVPYPSWGDRLARLTGTLLEYCQIVLAVLLLWVLWRTYSTSIRYFPAVVHTAGAFMTMREIYCFLTRMDVSTATEDIPRLLLLCLLPYATGVILALLFRHYIQKAGEKG
ncbi:MAG: DUF1700 domain-containing protein [Oscillospiraceae bacterium]|nr:DUF1700 domain-containing protein [Oscillospiraceae bacterium]